MRYCSDACRASAYRARQRARAAVRPTLALADVARYLTALRARLDTAPTDADRQAHAVLGALLGTPPHQNTPPPVPPDPAAAAGLNRAQRRRRKRERGN